MKLFLWLWTLMFGDGAPDDDPSEYSANWCDADERRRAGEAQAAFLRQRHETALGRIHDPQEL